MFSTCLLFLASTACAVEDPTRNLKGEKKLRKYFKNNLASLSGDEIKAIGSKNEDACTFIKSKDFDDSKKAKEKFRRHVNFECAQQMVKNNLDAFNSIFDDASPGEKMEFARRMGAGTICKVKDKFAKTEISGEVEELCSEPAKEAEKKKEEAPNSGNSMAISAAAFLSVASVLVFLAL